LHPKQAERVDLNVGGLNAVVALSPPDLSHCHKGETPVKIRPMIMITPFPLRGKATK
jgi:hypothetical protein